MLFRKLGLFARELGDYLSLFGENRSKSTVVFYSERDIFYQYFEGLIEHLLQHSNLQICYITSDPEDPVFNKKSARFHVFYLNQLLASSFARLNVRALVMTMTDLHRYHIKRSTFPVHYVYQFHAVVSAHLQYQHGAFDHYDAVLCCGPHHVQEIRKMEELYQLKRKTLIESGYYRIEKIHRDHQKPVASNTKRKQILIAPTWGESSILEICIDALISVLETSNYDVILRPHPEFTKRRASLMKQIQQRIENSPNIAWKSDLLSDTDIHQADVLITDRSGIAFEYAFGTERPVLFIDTPLKIQNNRYGELGIEPLEVSLRDKLGVSIPVADIPKIPEILEDFIANGPVFRQKIIECREKTLSHWMRSSEIEGDYILSLFEQ